MNIDTIIETRKRLDRDLRIALATMERKSTIYDIRTAIMENQRLCPHASDKYNWAIIDRCPYCGKNFTSNVEEEE